MERAAEWAGEVQASVGEMEKGGGMRLGRRAGQARKRRQKRAGPNPGVGLKRKEGRFFKMNFFSNSSFQIQAQFYVNHIKSEYVFNILFISNINEQFW